jgi:hypothetical protein
MARADAGCGDSATVASTVQGPWGSLVAGVSPELAAMETERALMQLESFTKAE